MIDQEKIHQRELLEHLHVYYPNPNTPESQKELTSQYETVKGLNENECIEILKKLINLNNTVDTTKNMWYIIDIKDNKEELIIKFEIATYNNRKIQHEKEIIKRLKDL